MHSYEYGGQGQKRTVPQKIFIGNISSNMIGLQKKLCATTWHLGDANRALYNLGSRLGNWEMPIVLSTIFGTRAKTWEIYVCISIYIILRTINTSTTNMPASATYMKALPRVTTREWFPARRPCVLHVLHSFSPWNCSPSFPCNLCLSFQRRHTALVSPIPTFGLSALSRGLLLRASSSQNGPAALWWKANRLPRGSGSLDRYMLIAA